jgi:hypothetical protein
LFVSDPGGAGGHDRWQPIGADTYSPVVDCVGLGGSNNVSGRELRARD